MNFEGTIKNSYPIGSIKPFGDSSKGQRVLLPNIPDVGSFNSTLDKYLDKNTILTMVYSNPTILNTLSNNKVPLFVNVDGFKKNVYNHSVDTKNTAIGIYRKLPQYIQQGTNLKDISDAALLHDFGKILIPENILNKKGSLSPAESNVMHLHSMLSSELLKNQGFSENAQNIIRYHHQNSKGTGYPIIAGTYCPNMDTEIVSLADKYSALREKRSYKRQLTQQAALGVLYNEVANKTVRPEVYDALTKYVMTEGNKEKNIKTLNNYFGIKNVAPRSVQDATFYS